MTRLSRYSEAAALLEGWALAACSLLFGRGVAAVYLSPAATDTAEGYAAAFAALEPVAEVGCILCDKAEEDILDALQESCQRASEGSRERLGFCGVDDSAAASSLASALNSERMVSSALPPPWAVRHALLWARAAVAGEILCESDPSTGFSGREIPLPEGLSRELGPG